RDLTGQQVAGSAPGPRTTRRWPRCRRAATAGRVAWTRARARPARGPHRVTGGHGPARRPPRLRGSALGELDPAARNGAAVRRVAAHQAVASLLGEEVEAAVSHGG